MCRYFLNSLEILYLYIVIIVELIIESCCCVHIAFVCNKLFMGTDIAGAYVSSVFIKISSENEI